MRFLEGSRSTAHALAATRWIPPCCSRCASVMFQKSWSQRSLGMTGLLILGCTMNRNVNLKSTPSVTRAPFGTLPDGRAVELFTLTNEHGVEVRAIRYGGIIISIRTADPGRALGHRRLRLRKPGGYLMDSPYFGAIVGRYANRIARAQFTLDGVTYQLARNNGPNTLHGGVRGFDKVLWSAEPFR